MALPKDVKFVTFDCYGTLIDWETGVYDAFQKEADRDGFTIDRDVLIPRFIDIQREIQRGSYELYAEVLRRTAVRVASELGWELEPSRSNFLPEQRARAGRPFRETNAQLERFSKKYELGHPRRTSTTSCSAPRAATSAWTSTSWSPPSRCAATSPTRPTSRSARAGSSRLKKNWVHIASGYPTDVEPCLKSKIPVIWVNRHGEELEGRKKPDAEVKTFRDAGKLLEAA